jgi:hypothetical protein
MSSPVKTSIQIFSTSHHDLSLSSKDEADILHKYNELDISFLPSIHFRYTGKGKFAHQEFQIFIYIAFGIMFKAFFEEVAKESAHEFWKLMRRLVINILEKIKKKTYAIGGKCVFVFKYRGIDCAVELHVAHVGGKDEISLYIPEEFETIFKKSTLKLKNFIDKRAESLEEAGTTSRIIPVCTPTTNKFIITIHNKADFFAPERLP